MFKQNDINIDTRLTELYKKQLQDKQLIKTGNLISSINIKFIMDNLGNGEIQIYGLEYLQYLDENNNISYDFLNDIETTQILEGIITEFTINYIVNSEVGIIDNINIILKYYF